MMPIKENILCIENYKNMNKEKQRLIDAGYKNETVLDKRGAKSLNTTFVFAAGRTFRAGSLNIPVNLFYSSQKGGGYVGLNVGFNVLKSKKPMNSKSNKF
jgi:hypothetical protein